MIGIIIRIYAHIGKAQMSENRDVLVIKDQSRQKKDDRVRLAYFADWLSSTGRAWYQPDLDKYRDYLLNERGLKPLSVRSHLATIRSRYRSLLDLPDSQAMFVRAVGQTEEGIPLDDAIMKLKGAIRTAASLNAGRIDAGRNLSLLVRLEGSDVLRLLQEPKYKTKLGLRDMILIGLLFCAGLSESELASLTDEDLAHDNAGNLTIRVARQDDETAQFVAVYDGLIFETAWIERAIRQLQRHMGAQEGLLFRGFFRGGDKVNSRSLTLRGIQKMLQGYPIEREGSEQSITALDLRRALARQLYVRGVDVEVIQQQFGHRQLNTTYEYIGPPDRGSSSRSEPRLDTSAIELRLRYWESKRPNERS